MPSIWKPWALSMGLLLLAHPSAGQGPVLLEDEFSDGDVSAWTTFVPGWSESGGVFRSSNVGANIPVEALYSGGLGWTDYVAEVDVRTSSAQPTSALALFVRDVGVPSTQAGRSFGSCDLFRNNLNQTFLVAGIHLPSLIGVQQVLGFGWNANTTYRLRATVSGQTLTCEVVGALGASLTVSHPMFSPTGTVGLRATHIPGEFDDLLVVGALVENQPPFADAGEDQLLDAGPACTALATLDGGGSFDPDGDPLTWTWTSASNPPLTGASPTVSLPLGTHELTLTVSDDRGGEDSDGVSIAVEDRTAPAISSVTVEPAILWPPDRRMRAVAVEAVAEDDCDPAPVCRVAGVTSSDPETGGGDGHTSPDWTITGDLGLGLRAERSGRQDRIYTVSVVCADAAGNESAGAATVVVPRRP